jgi:hypothetical protein
MLPPKKRLLDQVRDRLQLKNSPTGQRIGETGLALRPLIEAQAAEMLGIKKAGGSIQALMTRLMDLQLIETFRPWAADGAGAGGRFPDLVRLAERGQLAFWLSTEKSPVLMSTTSY